MEEVVEEMVGAIKDTGSEFLHAIEEAVGAREAFFELRKNSTGRAKFEFDLEEYCNTIDLDFNIVQELTYVYNGYQFCMNPSSGGVLENIIYLDGHNDQPEPNNDSGKDDHWGVCSLKLNSFRILNHLEIIKCYLMIIIWSSDEDRIQNFVNQFLVQYYFVKLGGDTKENIERVNYNLPLITLVREPLMRFLASYQRLIER